MGPSFIKFETSNFLSGVGLLYSHAFATQQSSPQAWVHRFIMLTPQVEVLSSTHTFLHRRCHKRQRNTLSHHCQKDFQHKESDQTLRQTSALMSLLGYKGSPKDRPPHWAQSNHTSEGAHIYSNLKTMSWWVLYKMFNLHFSKWYETSLLTQWQL